MINMIKIKLLLLALLFMAIPKSLWAYTKDDIVPLGDHIYKVLVPEGTTGVGSIGYSSYDK